MAAVSGSEAEDSAVAGDAVVVGAVVERPEVGTPVIGPDIVDTRLLGSLLVPLKK
jgi:hypothetical protein